jgi:hypothetical protein
LPPKKERKKERKEKKTKGGKNSMEILSLERLRYLVRDLVLNMKLWRPKVCNN